MSDNDFKFVELLALAPEEMAPGLTRRYSVGQQTTVTLFEYKKGAAAPMHSHIHEQISYVITGALKGRVGKENVALKAGDALLIPPGVPHKFEALEDTLEIDFFTPSRQDWIFGDNSYFRPKVKSDTPDLEQSQPL